MAERNVSFIIGANIKNFKSGLENAQKKFKKFGQSMTRSGQTLTRNLTAPLAGLAGLSIKAAADFESLEQSLSILNGSAEEGARIFKDLKDFAAGTPFQLGDIADAQKTLQGFGLSADTSFESIKNIGDIAAVVGGDIKAISVAFGQAGAEGMLMSKDIRQLVNQGVPALTMLADTMGVGKDEIFDLASQGEISFEILQQAFRDATAAGGQFEDGAAKQSQTLNGLFSTLRDNVTMALAEIGDSLVETFNLKEVAKDLIKRIQSFTEWFGSLSNKTKKVAFTIAAVFGAGGPILIALGAMATALSGLVPLIMGLVSPVGAVIAVVAGLAAVTLYIWDNWKALKERMSDINWWRNMVIDMAQFLIENSPISLLIKGVNSLLSYMGSVTIPNPYEGLADSLEGLKGDTKEYKTQFGSMKDAILNGASELSGIDFTNMFSGFGATGDVETPTPKPMKGIEFNNTFLPKIDTTHLDEATKKVEGYGTVTRDNLNGVKDDWSGFSEELANNIVPMISNALGKAAGDFIHMATQAALSGKSLKGVFSTVLMSLADLAIKVGKIAIATGIAIQGIKSALKSLNPIAAIAAGAALIALGGIVKSRLSKAAKMKDGGIVPPGFPNDSFPAMLSSGETVIPSPKALPSGVGGSSKVEVSGEFRIKGTDLVMTLEKATSKTLR